MFFCGWFFRLINLRVVGLICVTSIEIYRFVWCCRARLQSLISRHWTKFHGSVAQWCGTGSKSYGSFGDLEFSLWWPGNLSRYREELTCQICGGRWRLIWDFAMLTTTRLVILCLSQNSTFGHGYSMTSKTSLADVAWMWVNCECDLSLTFLKPHTCNTSRAVSWMVAQSSCCHETFESEQLKYFKIWDRKDWVEMHVIEVSRMYRGLCQSHIVLSRYKIWLASNVDSTDSNCSFLSLFCFARKESLFKEKLLRMDEHRQAWCFSPMWKEGWI